MTTLKKEKTEIEREVHRLKEKLDEFYFINKKLNEALTAANKKIHQYEVDAKIKGESTQVGDSDIVNNLKSFSHKRKISFDPVFLA